MLTSLDGREGGGGTTLTGDLGLPPPFLHLEEPEHFFFKTAGGLLFVATIKAWQHFTIYNDT